MMMKKKLIWALTALLLTGCNQSKSSFKVDKTRADAEKITLNYVKRLSDPEKHLYECIKPQELQADLKLKIVDFDEKVRNAKQVKTSPAKDGQNVTGIYCLSITQQKGRRNRNLLLNPKDGGSVLFSGEIGTTKFDGYLSVTSDLSGDFQSLVSGLSTVADGAEVEIRNN